MRGKSDVDALVKGTDHERLDLLPADFSYRHMDLALDATKRPTQRLGRVLAPLADDYDYVFLDCPPSISLVSESVFEAADALLVPLIPATLSSRTFEQLRELVEGGPRLLAFFSMVDARKRMHREVIERSDRHAPRGTPDRDPLGGRRGAHGACDGPRSRISRPAAARRGRTNGSGARSRSVSSRHGAEPPEVPRTVRGRAGWLPAVFNVALPG